MTVDGLQASGNAGPLAFLGRLTSSTAEPAPEAPSVPLRRAAAVLLPVGGAAAAAVVLLAAVGALLPDVPYSWGEFFGSTGWHLGYLVRILLAVVVLRRQPHNAAASWFAVLTGLEMLSELFGVLPDALDAVGAGTTAIATAALAESWLFGAAGVVSLELLVRIPAGGVEDRLRRWTRAAWLLVLVPPLAFATNDLVPVPWYAGEATLVNPIRLAVLDSVAGILAVLRGLTESLYVVGIVIVVVRYVRSGPATRRRLRWMLGVPVVSIGVLATILLFPDMPLWVLSLVSASAVVVVPACGALTLLGPDGLDVDRVLRRSLVYGVMWLAIAGLYVAAGAFVGTTAGTRLSPLGAAVTTVGATLAFQPARRWLERLADRWVFGNRADPARLVADLGATLEDTYDIDDLLPLIEDTLRRGLSVEWARVRLANGTALDNTDDDAQVPAVSVPILLRDEHLGVVECGQRRGRPLSNADAAVLRTFARQAALAIANVQLTTELTAKAEQLTQSRARLVRAQETERRRIERNIHDGVQQELVSLIQRAGEVEQDHAVGLPVSDELTGLRAGLAGLLTTLRELAAGIHPSLLTDRGLLPAVEALAARHPVPVSVRVDRTLRGRRFAEAVEGAGYFTVAECLANSLKHASASRVDVRLSQQNGSLLLEVEDDGDGFDLDLVDTGNGLDSLALRLEALGGGLTIDSVPGAGTTARATLPLTEEREGHG